MTGFDGVPYNPSMFTISLGKLFVIALVIWGVWRLMRRADMPARRSAPEVRPPDRRAASPATPIAEDLERCAVCGAYVPARHAPACGRADCPRA